MPMPPHEIGMRLPEGDMEIALTRTATLTDADTSLVACMAAGDEGALSALYAAYGRRLFAYAVRLTGSHAIAEEVVQDSLFAAWQGARRFRGGSRVLTWLLGIVHYQALNATRRKRQPAGPLDEALPMPDGGSSLQAQAESAECRTALRAALRELSRDHRAALELVFYQGLSLAEAAAVMGCPVGTVKSRLSYAKVRLKEALAQAGLRAEDVL